MELDSTVSLSEASESTSFPQGANVSGYDKMQSGQGVESTFCDKDSILAKWSEDPTSWGYLLVHSKKVIRFEDEVNADGCYHCFVHRSIVYKKSDHGVKKIEKPTVGGLAFLQGRTKDLQQYLRKKYPSLHLVNDRNTGCPAVIPDREMQPFMQIMKDDPTQVSILQKPLAHYAKGNIRLRVVSGVLKGQEGYLVRIDHDRKLVIKIGDLVVAVGGVYKEQFEEIKGLLESGCM